MRIVPPICALIGLLLLAACKVEVPMVSSGYYAYGWTSPRSSNHIKLSSAQIGALSEWLAGRTSGWDYRITDYAPGIYICLEHPREKPTWINLTADRIWVGNWYRLLTAAEYSAARAILQHP